MRKRDITDWTQKGKKQILHPTGPSRKSEKSKKSGATRKSKSESKLSAASLSDPPAIDKLRDTAGKAGLLMCAAAIVAVLAKGVKDGGLEEYRTDDE